MTQTKRKPVSKKVAPKNAATKKKTPPRKPAPASKDQGTEKQINGKQSEFLVRPVFSPINKLPTEALQHVLATVTKELENRGSGSIVTQQIDRNGGDGLKKEEFKEKDRGSNIGMVSGEQKQPIMSFELSSIEEGVIVLHNSLQRLNKLVNRASGEILEMPPSLSDIKEKESPQNMVAATRLINHYLKQVNHSLMDHINEIDRLI